eukprot:jgi/Chlat1/7403/Chrsp6S07488
MVTQRRGMRAPAAPAQTTDSQQSTYPGGRALGRASGFGYILFDIVRLKRISINAASVECKAALWLCLEKGAILRC